MKPHWGCLIIAYWLRADSDRLRRLLDDLCWKCAEHRAEVADCTTWWPEGIERGEIAARIWGLERRYRHGDLDVYMNDWKRRQYECLYRQVQPLITQALQTLESRGMVRLVRHGRYVKFVHLTPEGLAVARGIIEKKKNGAAERWDEPRRNAAGGMMPRATGNEVSHSDVGKWRKAEQAGKQR